MQPDAFAAERRERLTVADEALRPVIADALAAYAAGEADWSEAIVEEAAQLWLENYQAEAPGGSYRAAQARFAARLRDALDKTSQPDTVTDGQVDRIMRWLSTYAVNAGTVQGSYRQGVTEKMWVSMEDADVRETHQQADGQIVPIGSGFTVAGVKMAYPGEPVGPIENWINCVVGSTLVEGAGQSVFSLSRRESLGSLVEIRTIDGHHLTVTPNHPVLTPGGYVPAEALRPGDKVMATGVPVSPEVPDAPPSIEEFYRAARESGNSGRMDGSGVDFHGDAAESEVEIVWPNRDLPLEVRRKFGEPEFIVSDGGEVTLVGPGFPDPTVASLFGESVGTGVLTLRGIGVGRKVAALLRRHAPHPKAVRLAGGSDRQVEYLQIPGHDVAADAEVVRHLEHALAAGMSPSEIVSVEINPVVAATHVYNLHTSANWYSANGIAVHNCRCVAMPAARKGGVMTANTFELDGNFTAMQEMPGADEDMPEPQDRTGALVVLLPADSDPITAASSEDITHMTTVWFGDLNEMTVDREELEQAVRLYAQDLDGPVVVPVKERGELGDESADVVFLEATDSLVALRDGLLANEPVRTAHDAAEQYPEWTPHVTLGYPEGVEGGPAVAEYDGTEVTFDRIGLWLGADKTEYTMGGIQSPVIADAAAVIADVDDELVEADAEEEVVDEPDDDEDLITEIPVHGVLAPEEVETGDGRGFRAGALSSRPLPIPLRLEIISSHGGNNTSEVVTVGRIDEVFRVGNEMRYRGAIILSKPHAAAAIEGILDGSGMGVSIDADAMSVDMQGFTDEIIAAAEAEGRRATTWYSSARVAGLTIVPIPAFLEAYVGLGHEFPEELTEDQRIAAAAALEDCGCGDADEAAAVVADATFAPGTKDGPGWITHPVPTSRIRRYWVRGEGAAKIKWGVGGDFNRCRSQLAKYVQNPEWLAGLCANMHREALGIWPAQHAAAHSSLVAAGGVPAPIMTWYEDEPEEGLVAAAGGGAFPAEWFANPRFRSVTPMHIDKETGRIWGHLAQWGVCHIGIAGKCIQAPRSSTNYANFLKGEIDTDRGPLSVGCLTYGIGHANPMMRAAAATAHYDKPDAVFAYVNVGEDAFGVWYSGVLRPGFDMDKIDEIRATGALSGDWRVIGRHGHDLVAAVNVITPGYPVSIAASAIIAAGVVLPGEQIEEAITAAAPISNEDANRQYLADAIALALEKRDAQLALQARERDVRARALSLRQADIRRRLERI